MTTNPAVTIHKNITRPTADIVTQFEVPTGYIADVQGRRGALDCGIKPMFEFPPFAGPAVTVRTVPDDNLAVFAAMGVVQAGDVMIGDRDGVAVLPQEKIPRALEEIQALRERERNIEERIAAGMTMPDWVKAFLAGDRVKYIE